MKLTGTKKPCPTTTSYKVICAKTGILAMGSLNQVVKFNNQDVPVFFYENKPYVAIKPICENIGLDWNGQFQRIKRNHVLNEGICMIHIPSKGGVQKTLALPIGYLNGWLFGIDVNRVKPEIKDTLIKYQLECYDVLYNHFMPKVAEAHPNTITIEQQQQIKDAVFAKVYRDGRTYQAVYSEFYREFNIPRYQELPISKFEDALKWLNEGFYSPKAKNLDDDVYNLIYKLVEAVLIENDEMKRLCQAIKLINEPSFNQYAHYIVRSNELARKVSWHFNFMNKFDEPLIDRNCRYVSLSGGKKIAVNPNWYNCEA